MLFEIEHLTYQYEGVTAIDDLTLAVPPGRTLELRGSGEEVYNAHVNLNQPL